jgi:hypothetical protein
MHNALEMNSQQRKNPHKSQMKKQGQQQMRLPDIPLGILPFERRDRFYAMSI